MYRRSSHVWLEIAGLLGLLVLLLGPLAYLALELTGGGRLGGGDGGGGAAARSAPGSSGPPVAQRSRSPAPPRRSTGIATGRPHRSPPTSRAPFSETWRAQATPDLSSSDPAPSGNAVASGSPPGAAAWNRTGGPSPSADLGTVPAGRSGTTQHEGGAARNPARRRGIAEAQRLGGQARALSRRLGALDRNSGGRAEASSADRTSAPDRAKTADDPGLPDEPTVPIDDHLHWLLVAGVLWGAWRVHRG